jgi:hypothetical protein
VSSAVTHPEIGHWYERTNSGEIFQITGIDENAKTIELQAFDGAIDEIDGCADSKPQRRGRLGEQCMSRSCFLEHGQPGAGRCE